MLEDDFRLEDEGEVGAGSGRGRCWSVRGTTGGGIGRLFPHITTTVTKKRTSGASRLEEELTRKVLAGTLISVVSSSPCYCCMNVFFEGGGRLQTNSAKVRPQQHVPKRQLIDFLIYFYSRILQRSVAIDASK